MRYFEEVKELMNSFPVKKLHFVATDGVGRVMKEEIEEMNEEEYQIYLNYHFSICSISTF